MQVSPFLLQGLYAYLSGQGAAEAFLREGEVPRDLLQGARGRIELDAMVRAGRAAYLAATDPAVALRAGCAAPIRTLGPLGYLLLQCSSLRRAIEELEPYVPLLATRGGVSLRAEGATTRLILDLPIHHEDVRRFATEYLFALLLRFAREFLGHAVAPQELRLPYAQPLHVREYERIFACPLRFEAARAEVLIDTELLDRPQRVVNERLRVLLKDEVDAALESEVTGAPVHLRVYSLLKSDPALWDAGPSVLAKLVGLSARTLRRRLTREGKSLSSLVEDARMDRARYLLTETDIAIKGIAERLGYSEPSAFHRAFKRWTGQTPGRFKREHQALSVAC